MVCLSPEIVHANTLKLEFWSSVLVRVNMRLDLKRVGKPGNTRCWRKLKEVCISADNDPRLIIIVSKLIVAINKMDDASILTEDKKWSEERYKECTVKLTA
jgi:hypothetical protein